MTTATEAPSRWQRFANARVHSFLALPARFYLGAVFLLACWHKILHPESFALDVATYQFLPLEAVNLFALVLPWIELLAGILIIVGYRTEAAAALIAGMMVAFLVALSVALGRGLEMGCGCFASSGAEEDPISWHTLVRDGAWLALALYVLVFDRRPLGIDGWWARRKEKNR